MKLIEEEEIISVNMGGLILTNYRIKHEHKENGVLKKTVLFIEEIDGIQTHRKNPTYYLYIAAVLVLGTFYYYSISQDITLLIGGLVFAGIFIGIWNSSRQYLLSIVANGKLSIDIEMNKTMKNELENLLFEISKARASLRRYNAKN